MYILKYTFLFLLFLVISKGHYIVYNLSEFISSLHTCEGSCTLLHMG